MRKILILAVLNHKLIRKTKFDIIKTIICTVSLCHLGKKIIDFKGENQRQRKREIKSDEIMYTPEIWATRLG